MINPRKSLLDIRESLQKITQPKQTTFARLETPSDIVKGADYIKAPVQPLPLYQRQRDNAPTDSE